MAHASAVRVAPRRTPARRTRGASGRRRGHSIRRVVGVLLAIPLALRLLLLGVVIVALWWALNWAYQVVRKPTELFFPVSGALSKTPAQTWRSYGSLFREHSTATMTPDLLAALAQVEGAGNPVARTYWRWRLSWNPLELYQPASSAVGMYQITDPTFQEAALLHPRPRGGGGWPLERSAVVLVQSHVHAGGAEPRRELTAALLDRTVTRTLERQRITTATLQQRQDLAAVIHLCGAGAGQAYAGRGLRLTPGQRCGDHDVARYLAERQRDEAAVRSTGRDGCRLILAEGPSTLLWPAALIVTFLIGWAVAGVTRYRPWTATEVAELRKTVSRQQQQVATLQARLHARESLASARSSGESAPPAGRPANEVMSATMTSARATEGQPHRGHGRRHAPAGVPVAEGDAGRAADARGGARPLLQVSGGDVRGRIRARVANAGSGRVSWWKTCAPWATSARRR